MYENTVNDEEFCYAEDIGDMEVIKIAETLNTNRKKLYKNN